MNISLEKTTPVSAVITLNLEKSDYELQVKESLKKFCKKANMPGFRPGKVPMSLANKLYGAQAKMESVNSILGEKLFEYIRNEKINMLGEPLPHEGQEAQDIENQDNFEFKFDIAIAPEFSIELTGKDQITYYNIEVSDEQINQRIEGMRRQLGSSKEFDTYEDGDILRGLLAELDENGQPKTEGLQIEKVSLMPKYFKNEDQAKIFTGAKKNDVITFNPSVAYDNNETELASLLKVKKEALEAYKGNFSFQVDEISRFVPAELDQDFFNATFGEGNVKSEEDLREKVKEQIQESQKADSDYRFLIDVREYAEKKVGELQFPEAELRRIMIANNKDKDEKYVDDNFKASIEELKWHLIREQLAQANDVKIETADLKNSALQAVRFQFAQYGMGNVPDQYLQQYADEMLKNQEQVRQLTERAIDDKLIAKLKEVVKLKEKNISVEDFQKLFEKK